jgi:hypothetical protein
MMRRVHLIALSIALTAGAHTVERSRVHGQLSTNRAPKPITRVAQPVSESAFQIISEVGEYRPFLKTGWEKFFIGGTGTPGSEHLLVREFEGWLSIPIRWQLFDLGALKDHPDFDARKGVIVKEFSCFYESGMWVQTKLPDRSVVMAIPSIQPSDRSSTRSGNQTELCLRGFFTDGRKDPTTGKPAGPLYQWSDGN